MKGPNPAWRKHVLTAIAALAVAVPAVLFLFGGAGALPSLRDRYEVRAVLPNSSGLAAQSRVTMAGVEIGEVREVERQGGAVVVTMELDDEHSSIPADSTAAVRLRTLVGEKSIELTPGHSRALLPDGGALPMSQDDFVEVDEILSELRGRTRDRVRATIRALGTAVRARGTDLNRALESTSDMIDTGAPVVRALAGEHRHITRLVESLGALAAEIGDRGTAVSELSRGATRTFSAIARRDDALRGSLERLPATLGQVRRAATTLRATTEVATPVVTRLATAVERLEPTVPLLRPAVRETRSALLEGGRAAAPLTSVLSSLERFSVPGARTLPRIRSALCELNPVVRYVSPYYRELAALIQGLGSAVNAYDANGHIARLYIGAGPNSLIGAIPPDVAQAQSRLFSMGALQKVNLLGYNPYPAPGKVNENEVGRRSVGPADAENRYTRVQADC